MPAVYKSIQQAYFLLSMCVTVLHSVRAALGTWLGVFQPLPLTTYCAEKNGREGVTLILVY